MEDLKDKIGRAARAFLRRSNPNKFIDRWKSYPEEIGFIKGALSPEAKEYWQQEKIKQVVFNGDIDTIGQCANCGVEFHIHKPEQQITYTDEEALQLLITALGPIYSRERIELWFNQNKKKH